MVKSVLLALAFIFVLSAAGPSARAGTDEERAEAQTLVNKGLSLAGDGNFAAAIPLFERAFRLYPHPDITHNLARAHQKNGGLEKAWFYFKEALHADSGYTHAADGRRYILEIEEELKTTSAKLTIRTTPSQVEVTVTPAGKPQETFIKVPFETWVPAGNVLVVGANPSFKTGRRELQLVAGEERELNLVLVPLPKKGFLQVSVNVPSARIYLNDVHVGTAPMESVAHPAGIFTLRVLAEGHEPHTEQVTIAPDELASVAVALRMVGASDPIGPPDGTDPSVIKGTDKSDGGLPAWVGWTGIGAGVAVGVVGAVFHADAFDTQSQANKIPANSGAANDARYNTLHDEAISSQRNAFIAYGFAAALVGTGVVLVVLSGDDEPEPGVTRAPSFQPTFSAGPGYVGGGATLSF